MKASIETSAGPEVATTQPVQRTALHPRDEIIGVARELSADLLLISTHGYTGWKHFLFGSDAEKIIEHACCPTLVVRSDATTAYGSFDASNALPPGGRK